MLVIHMDKLSGIGSTSRERLSRILRISKGIITTELVSKELDISKSEASKMLWSWARQGWLYKIKRGLYVPVPLESSSNEPAIEDPWIIADYLYDPCYIGGWTAAEYWDLTEQIYNSIVIITSKSNNRKKNISFGNIDFYIKSLSDDLFFGYKGVWRGQVKVNVSDPSRTIIDMLNDVRLGGGIRPIYDILKNYLRSDNKDLQLMFEYASNINNKTVFKRLGFLLEIAYPEESSLIEECRSQISSGYSKLDPNLDSDKLISKWNLSIPNSWYKEVIGDK